MPSVLDRTTAAHILAWPLAALFLSACGTDYRGCPRELDSSARAVAQCSTLTVPMNRVIDNGQTVSMPVMRFSPPTPSSKTPLLFLEGGPGASVINNAAAGPELAARFNRDIIYFEQRGTRGASPSLECGSNEDPGTCLNRFANDGIQLSSFNTIESAADVAQLSTTLGTKFIIWGQSYGTLLAQRVAQKHPDVVEGLVLEGSLPAGGFSPLLETEPANIVVLKRFSAWIKVKFAQINATPRDIDPEQDFPAAIDELAKYPTLTGLPQGHAPASAETILRYMRNLPAYAPTFSLWAYNVNHKADRSDTQRFTQVAFSALAAAFQSIVSLPDYFAVNCSDQIQFWTDAQLADWRAKLTMPAEIADRRLEQMRQYAAVCKAIFAASPSGYATTEFSSTVLSDVNTLFLIGDLDTQTPAEWAPTANFQNARVVHGSCIGHGFFEQEPGLYAVMGAFLDNPTVTPNDDVVTQFCTKPITQPTLDLRGTPLMPDDDMGPL